jgi:hypothetical protein
MKKTLTLHRTENMSMNAKVKMGGMMTFKKKMNLMVNNRSGSQIQNPQNNLKIYTNL